MTPPLLRTVISIAFALAAVIISMFAEWRDTSDYGPLLVGLSFIVVFYTPPLIPFICLILVPMERYLRDIEAEWRIVFVAPLLGLGIPAVIFFLLGFLNPDSFPATLVIFVMSGACGLAWGLSYFLPKRSQSEQPTAAPQR